MANGFFGDALGNSLIQDYEHQRQKYDYERALAHHQAMAQGQAMNTLAGALGMQQQQQAVRAAPPKQDPQPNPVLLLTGEDE